MILSRHVHTITSKSQARQSCFKSMKSQDASRNYSWLHVFKSSSGLCKSCFAAIRSWRCQNMSEVPCPSQIWNSPMASNGFVISSSLLCVTVSCSIPVTLCNRDVTALDEKTRACQLCKQLLWVASICNDLFALAASTSKMSLLLCGLLPSAVFINRHSVDSAILQVLWRIFLISPL